MLKEISTVRPLENFILEIHYITGEKILLDIKPYLNMPMYRKLSDLEMFKTANVSIDKITIEWKNGIDLPPEDIEKYCIPV